MNYLHHTKKYYFSVMLIEFCILSIIYWLMFPTSLSSAVAYIISSLFYLTSFDFWLYTLKKSKHLAISFSEHFFLTIIPLLFLVLAGYSFIKSSFLLALIYILISLTIIFYYKFRIKKQEEYDEKQILHRTALSVMTLLFMTFDLAVFCANLMSIQLALYMPVLFVIFTVLYFIYKKDLSFQSFISVIIFAGIYIVSSAMLVVNFASANSFTIMLLIHFIMMISTVFFFKLNAKSSEFETIYIQKEFIAMLFSNVVLCFIALNNICCFVQIPVFLNYMFMYSVLLIAYLCFCNYKIILNS